MIAYAVLMLLICLWTMWCDVIWCDWVLWFDGHEKVITFIEYMSPAQHSEFPSTLFNFSNSVYNWLAPTLSTMGLLWGKSVMKLSRREKKCIQHCCSGSLEFGLPVISLAFERIMSFLTSYCAISKVVKLKDCFTRYSHWPK